VVGEAVLREVVGTDFVRTIAGAYLLLALLGLELVDALSLYFVEAGTEDAHGLLAILDLRLFVLAAHHRVGGKMRDADGRVGGVDRLAAGAGGTERVDAEILLFDLDVDFFGFREDGYGDGRGVDAALRFGGGDTLDAVDAGLVLHLSVDALAFHDGGDVLEAAYVGLGFGEDFYLPLVLLGEAKIHAKDFGDEERGFVSAGAGAEFEDDVLVVVGIFGEEQNFQLFLGGGESGLEVVELGLGHLAHLGIGFGEHGLGVVDGGVELAVLAKLLDGGLHVAVLLGDLAVVFLVVDDVGVGELQAELFVAGFELVEAVKHGALLLLRAGIREQGVGIKKEREDWAQLGKVATGDRVGRGRCGT
jgi:hypothetical protein